MPKFAIATAMAVCSIASVLLAGAPAYSQDSYSAASDAGWGFAPSADPEAYNGPSAGESSGNRTERNSAADTWYDYEDNQYDPELRGTQPGKTNKTKPQVLRDNLVVTAVMGLGNNSVGMAPIPSARFDLGFPKKMQVPVITGFGVVSQAIQFSGSSGKVRVMGGSPIAAAAKVRMTSTSSVDLSTTSANGKE